MNRIKKHEMNWIKIKKVSNWTQIIYVLYWVKIKYVLDWIKLYKGKICVELDKDENMKRIGYR